LAISFRSIGALKAIRLSESTRSSLADSYAQLSSGKRITRPGDDPGGLAVSMSLAVEAKISDRAKLNIEDGVSLSSYAESAFDSATDIVQRMNELASQASAGILGTKQRSALNSEFTALRDELSRLQKASQFNGMRVNDGGVASSTAKRVGASGSSAFEISADGRYAFYVEGNILKMRDTITDQISNLDTGVSSADIGVSAAGDKIAYIGSGGVKLFDRLSGTSQVVIGSVSSASALEISGDGTTIAVVARTYYNAEGTTASSDGAYHLISYDVGTGRISGDAGRYNLLTNETRDLQISFNGDYIGFRGGEATELAVADEVLTFSKDGLSADPLFVTNTGDKFLEAFAIDNSGNVYGGLTGAPTYISKFSASDNSGNTYIYSRAAVMLRGVADAGSALVFSSNANITGDNSQLKTQLFKLDLVSGDVRQVSNFSSEPTYTSLDRVSGDGYSLIKYNSTGGTFDYYDNSPKLSVNIDTGNGRSGLVSVGILALDGAARGLKGLGIDTAASAKSAVFQLARTSESLALAQSALGASVSRLQSSSRATASRGLEQKAAFGRVNDLDTAEAAGRAVRLQILNQSQVGIIAQASRMSPQIALKLLVGE
jgi:flagellin